LFVTHLILIPCDGRRSVLSVMRGGALFFRVSISVMLFEVTLGIRLRWLFVGTRTWTRRAEGQDFAEKNTTP